MQIRLANPRGFCAGVDRAIDIVNRALDVFGPPVYVRHEVVHNRYVVDGLRERGAVFVDELEEVPDDAIVIFSAHGVSKAVQDEAEQRALQVFDATCPLVTKVHMEAVRYARQGFKILLVGHAGHDEVVGTVGEAPDAITIIESPQDVEQLTFGPEVPLAYLTQTTLSMDDADRIIDAIRKKYPNVKAPPSEDICYATTNRQHAVRELAADADLVLVVGSKNSSNSVRLTEISENSGTAARLVDNRSEINNGWFDGVETVLVTAGASAPEHLVQEIVEYLIDCHGGEVHESHVVEEDMHFNFPVSLRVLRENVATSGS